MKTTGSTAARIASTRNSAPISKKTPPITKQPIRVLSGSDAMATDMGCRMDVSEVGKSPVEILDQCS